MGHTTQPPARYTEASLVKALEELGIGRPSTYASIMQTIQDRGYVFKRGQALIPSFTAFAVVGLLERHYPRLVDYGFTASMEDELDEIAVGEAARVEFLRAFYFGSDERRRGLGRPCRRSEEAGHREAGRDRRPGGQLDPAVHRRGRARGRGPGRAVRPVPAAVTARGRRRRRGGRGRAATRGRHPGRAGAGRADAGEGRRSCSSAASGERKLGEHPETGEPIVLRSGRYGPYVSHGDKNASLLRSQSPDQLTLDDALQAAEPAAAGRPRPGGQRDLRRFRAVRAVHQAG